MVSIIVPVYQVSDYIERCIRSVITQSYPEIECIIVDDATHDDSIDKCSSLITNYAGSIRFNILHHDENHGLSAARNTGIKAATGDYVYFLDSDDEITPDCIGQLVSVTLDYPDADMVIGNHIRHDVGFTEKGFAEGYLLESHSNEEAFSAFEKGEIPVYAWNKLIRRDFFLNHNLYFIEGILGEDMPWSFFLFKYLSRMVVCEMVTYHHFIRPDSIITGTDNHTFGHNYINIYNVILHNLTPGRESRELNIYVERFCKRYLEHRNEIPEYKTLMKDYRQLARKFGNSSVVHKLDLARMISLLPVSVTMLQKGWMKTHCRRHSK